MDVLSELRRTGHHVVGTIFVLALYCGILGADAASAALASVGAVLLAALAVFGGSQSGTRLDDSEADENDDSGLDDLQLENQW